jgi:hypothetical protein
LKLQTLLKSAVSFAENREHLPHNRMTLRRDARIYSIFQELRVRCLFRRDCPGIRRYARILRRTSLELVKEVKAMSYKARILLSLTLAPFNADLDLLLCMENPPLLILIS